MIPPLLPLQPLIQPSSHTPFIVTPLGNPPQQHRWDQYKSYPLARWLESITRQKLIAWSKARPPLRSQLHLSLPPYNTASLTPSTLPLHIVLTTASPLLQLFFLWMALNRQHLTTVLYVRGAERKRRRLVEEKSYPLARWLESITRQKLIAWSKARPPLRSQLHLSLPPYNTASLTPSTLPLHIVLTTASPLLQLFFLWMALNRQHLTTVLYVRGAERKRRRLVEEEARIGEDKSSSAYGKPMDMVMPFNNLSPILTMTDYDRKEVIVNLQKARRNWSCL